MTTPKTLEQLRAEKERAETQLAQEQHKIERLENRKKYLEKGERTKRTHRLCNLGGTVESLAPEIKDLTRTEMTELMEYIFSLAEVQRAVRHMAITHISQANREKQPPNTTRALRSKEILPQPIQAAPQTRAKSNARVFGTILAEGADGRHLPTGNRCRSSVHAHGQHPPHVGRIRG